MNRMRYLRENFVHPPVDYEEELLEAIRTGNEQGAKQALAKINELEAAVLAAYPLRSKKNALIASCTLFTRAIIKGGVDPEIAFHLSDKIIMDIEKSGTWTGPFSLNTRCWCNSCRWFAGNRKSCLTRTWSTWRYTISGKISLRI
ncbi:hypothetical protein HMSSN036_48030 [Paenibacillus macerans]|nr:hypothetical protein HMSSN036_48030 [Paenibacillus macerans]